MKIHTAKLQKIIEKTKHFPDYFLTEAPPRRKETEAADPMPSRDLHPKNMHSLSFLCKALKNNGSRFDGL